MSKIGRPAKIQGEHPALLAALVESDPTTTLGELRAVFAQRTGIDAHEQTIVSTLQKFGVRRDPSREAVVVEQAS